MNIPDFCYTLNNMTVHPKTKIGKIIIIKALETGYYKTLLTGTQKDVDALNVEIGVSRAQEEAMSFASMFGWEGYKNLLIKYEEIFANKEKE